MASKFGARLNMAITFNGTSTYIEAAWAASHPMTLACWARSTSQTIYQALISVGVSGGVHRNVLGLNGNTGGDPVQATAQGSSAFNASTSAAYAANTWQHYAATFADASNRAAFLNGGSKGTSTGASGVTGLDSIALGARYNTTRGAFLVGRMAEAAVWTSELSDEEIASLAKGVCPLRVRPQSLVFYAPLVREVIDFKGAALTSASLAITDHPRTYR